MKFLLAVTLLGLCAFAAAEDKVLIDLMARLLANELETEKRQYDTPAPATEPPATAAPYKPSKPFKKDCEGCDIIFADHVETIKKYLYTAASAESSVTANLCDVTFYAGLQNLEKVTEASIKGCSDTWIEKQRDLQEIIKFFLQVICPHIPPRQKPTKYDDDGSGCKPPKQPSFASCKENGNAYAPLRGCAAFYQGVGYNIPKCIFQTHPCGDGTLYNVDKCVCDHYSNVDASTCKTK